MNRRFAIAVRRAPHWFVERVAPRRYLIWLVCFLLGCVIGGFVYQARKVAEHNRQTDRRQDRADRKQRALIEANRDLIRRLDRLEHPTRADIERLIRRFVGGLSAGQARQLVVRAGIVVPVGGGPFGQPPPSGGGGSTPGPEGPGRGPSRPSPSRPGPSVPRPPSPRPPVPPRPLPQPAHGLLCPLVGSLLPPQLGLC